jgi:hypothetical protein
MKTKVVEMERDTRLFRYGLEWAVVTADTEEIIAAFEKEGDAQDFSAAKNYCDGKPSIGKETVCEQCGRRALYNGERWIHVDGTYRHRVIPGSANANSDETESKSPDPDQQV